MGNYDVGSATLSQSAVSPCCHVGGAREKKRGTVMNERGEVFWNICQESERSRKVLSVGPHCQRSSRRHEGKQECYVSPFLSHPPQIKRRVRITTISISLTHKEYVDKSGDCKQLAELTKMDRISVDRVSCGFRCSRHADYSVMEHDFLPKFRWNMWAHKLDRSACTCLTQHNGDDDSYDYAVSYFLL